MQMGTSMLSEKPRIYDYLSPISYLQDVYKYRKKKDAGFTFEKWSDELGFKSRSFVKMLITGNRKITPRFTSVYSQAYSFLPPERDYLSLITSYSQCENKVEKEIYQQKIFELRGQVKKVRSVDGDQFLTPYYIPHIQTLLSFKDIHKSIPVLCDILSLSEEEVSRALEKLESLGLAEKDSSETWKAVQDSFEVGIKFGDQSLRNYHNQSLREAMDAQNLPSEVRRFRSSMFALSEEEYLEVIGYIEAFISHKTAKYDVDKIENRRLYKMNLNIFPISKKYK